MLEVKVAVGELFTRLVLKDVAQEVMDCQLAQAAPDEMAQLIALLCESTGA